MKYYWRQHCRNSLSFLARMRPKHSLSMVASSNLSHLVLCILVLTILLKPWGRHALVKQKTMCFWNILRCKYFGILKDKKKSSKLTSATGYAGKRDEIQWIMSLARSREGSWASLSPATTAVISCPVAVKADTCMFGRKLPFSHNLLNYCNAFNPILSHAMFLILCRWFEIDMEIRHQPATMHIKVSTANPAAGVWKGKLNR